jgi:hypothetical protein
VNLEIILEKLNRELESTERSISNISSDVFYELQDKEDITIDDVRKAAEKHAYKNVDSEHLSKITKEVNKLKRERAKVVAR